MISPTYSHAASLLAVSAFWYASVRMRDVQSARRYVALGALCGAAALMRWQDAILLVVPAIDLLAARRGGLSFTQMAVRGVLTVASTAAVVCAADVGVDDAVRASAGNPSGRRIHALVEPGARPGASV